MTAPEARTAAHGKYLFLQKIIVLEPVVASRRVEYPVPDIYKVKESAKFLVGEFDIHGDSSFRHKRVDKNCHLYYLLYQTGQ